MRWTEAGLAALADTGLPVPHRLSTLLVIDRYVRTQIALSLQIGAVAATREPRRSPAFHHRVVVDDVGGGRAGEHERQRRGTQEACSPIGVTSRMAATPSRAPTTKRIQDGYPHSANFTSMPS